MSPQDESTVARAIAKYAPLQELDDAARLAPSRWVGEMTLVKSCPSSLPGFDQSVWPEEGLASTIIEDDAGSGEEEGETKCAADGGSW